MNSFNDLALSLRRRGKASKASAVMFSWAILALLLCVPLGYRAYNLPTYALIYAASVVLTVLFVVHIWSWYHVSQSLFDPFIVFSSAAMLFNGSLAVLVALHLNSTNMFEPNVSEQTTLTTVYLVTLSLWSYHVGGLLVAYGVKRRSRCRGVMPRRNEKNLRVFGWFLIGIGIVPTFINLRDAATLVMSSGYFGLFQREAATSLNALPQVVAAFLVPGVMWVAAFCGRNRSQLLVTAVLIGLYALSQLFLGSRALAIAALVPYTWVWHRCIKPVPRLPIISGALILFIIVLPTVRGTRSTVGEDRLSRDSLSYAIASIDNPALSIVLELGGTASTVAYTVDLVPDFRPYDGGKSYAYGLFTLVPNVFWDLHPTVARGTPANWLVQTVDPYQASQGGGLGYSFIAEAYLNAGWAGVILVSCVLGFMFAKLATSFARQGDLAGIACTATILSFTMKYARSDCTEVIRGVVWYALCPYVLAMLVSGTTNSVSDGLDLRSTRG